LPIKRTEEVTDFSAIDFKSVSLPIGVKLPMGGEEWLPFDYEDLKVLRYLLAKSLPVKGVDGRITEWTRPACEASVPLNSLLLFVEAALRWHDRSRIFGEGPSSHLTSVALPWKDWPTPALAGHIEGTDCRCVLCRKAPGGEERDS
jgi:hypothetical protein